MQSSTFDRILTDLEALSPRPTVIFGGYGEPLFHPHILEMLRATKKTGARVEIITNATLLDENIVNAFIDFGLDFVWISLDGATPESFADIRLGAQLPTVLENMEHLDSQRLLRFSKKPELGISFVAMKRNIKDLWKIISIALNNHARKLSVSNVLPLTKELKEEMLFERTEAGWRAGHLDLDFPRMDVDEGMAGVVRDLIFWFGWNGIVGQSRERRLDLCPFVERGSTSVRFDGRVSPCQPLMYDHPHYLGERLRHSSAYTVGSVLDSTISELWQQTEYVSLRKRLAEFDYSPCTECNSCDLAEHNLEDCFGNDLPACGGCLWAQGFINCP